MARLLGVQVDTFQVGFGKSLLSISKWGTIWSLRLLPLGGAVSISKKEQDRLCNTSPFRMIMIYLAGPLANMTIAVSFFFLLLAKYNVEYCLFFHNNEYHNIYKVNDYVIINSDHLLSSAEKNNTLMLQSASNHVLQVTGEDVMNNTTCFSVDESQIRKGFLKFSFGMYFSFVTGIVNPLLWNDFRSILSLVSSVKMRHENSFLPSFSLYISHIIISFIMINLIVGLFNLVPLFPLDGGGVVLVFLRMLLRKKNKINIFFINTYCIFSITLIISFFVFVIFNDTIGMLF